MRTVGAVDLHSKTQIPHNTPPPTAAAKKPLNFLPPWDNP